MLKTLNQTLTTQAEQSEKPLATALVPLILHICETNKTALALITEDIKNSEMNLVSLADFIESYAEEYQSNRRFSFDEKAATKLICEFYHIPNADKSESVKQPFKALNLSLEDLF